MNKKLLTTLTALSISFVAFLSGYLLSQKDFHRSSNLNSSGNILDKFSDQNPASPEARLPEEPALRLLSSRSVMSPVLSKEKNSVLYHEKGTGKVFEIALGDLREKSVSETPLANLIKTIWAPSRKEVVALFYYPQENRYKYFDYKTKTSVDLGGSIKSPAFSPDGSQVAYFGTKENSRGIFISKPDGSSFKNIFPSRLENAEVYWPSDNLLAFKIRVTDGYELFSLSKTGEIKKILKSGDELEVKWSKDGSRILFSQKTDSGIGLFYKNTVSESETPLNVPTSASKCDWGIAGETITCGVLGTSASGDEFYEIGLDGTKKLLSSPTTRINTEELFLAGLDDYVVILNGLDNKLYVLKK